AGRSRRPAGGARARLPHRRSASLALAAALLIVAGLAIISLPVKGLHHQDEVPRRTGERARQESLGGAEERVHALVVLLGAPVRQAVARPAPEVAPAGREVDLGGAADAGAPVDHEGTVEQPARSAHDETQRLYREREGYRLPCARHLVVQAENQATCIGRRAAEGHGRDLLPGGHPRPAEGAGGGLG